MLLEKEKLTKFYRIGMRCSRVLEKETPTKLGLRLCLPVQRHCGLQAIGICSDTFVSAYAEKLGHDAVAYLEVPVPSLRTRKPAPLSIDATRTD